MTDYPIVAEGAYNNCKQGLSWVWHFYLSVLYAVQEISVI